MSVPFRRRTGLRLGRFALLALLLLVVLLLLILLLVLLLVPVLLALVLLLVVLALARFDRHSEDPGSAALDSLVLRSRTPLSRSPPIHAHSKGRIEAAQDQSSQRLTHLGLVHGMRVKSGGGSLPGSASTNSTCPFL